MRGSNAVVAVERGRTRSKSIAIVVVLLLGGLSLRSLVSDGADSPLVRWLPWLDREPVVLFFTEPGAATLIPVSRDVDRGAATPERLVEDLLAGPEASTGLVNAIPAGSTVRAVTLVDGRLSIDLAGGFGTASPLAVEAVHQSAMTWPGVDEVSVLREGVPAQRAGLGHLLYFYDEARDMLVASPTNGVTPADVLGAWLEGPADSRLMGLPADVRALGVDLGDNELLTLRFTYRESLRRFAIDHPESVRRVLEGLIATFNTGFPDVGAVLLDFEGRNALGLGQCANLLNTAQLMPETLNDERLLSRTVVSDG